MNRENYSDEVAQCFFIDENSLELKRFTLCYDTDVNSPRIEFYNVGKLCLGNPDYRHNNDEEFQHADYDDSLLKVIIKHCDTDDIIKYANKNLDFVITTYKNSQEKEDCFVTTNKDTGGQNTFYFKDNWHNEGDTLLQVLYCHCSEDELCKMLIDLGEKNNLCVLPVYENYKYNFSTETRCEPSVPDGFIYCTKEDAVKEWGENNWLESAKNYLKGEIEDFTTWANGNVYGHHEDVAIPFSNEKGDIIYQWEEYNSVWGFYDNEYDHDKIIHNILDNEKTYNVLQLKSIPDFLTHKTTAQNFEDSLKQCIKCFSPESSTLEVVQNGTSNIKKYQDSTINKALAILCKNMTPSEIKKVDKIFKNKQCDSAEKVTAFINKVAMEEEHLITPKTRKNIQKEEIRER